MSSLKQLITAAFEGVSGNTIDIYGSTNTTSAQDSLNEAINDQLGAIAEQESAFTVLRQRRQNTPITDEVESIVQTEKERVTELRQRLPS